MVMVMKMYELFVTFGGTGIVWIIFPLLLALLDGPNSELTVGGDIGFECFPIIKNSY
jgi:hypothetical protein